LRDKGIDHSGASGPNNQGEGTVGARQQPGDRKRRRYQHEGQDQRMTEVFGGLGDAQPDPKSAGPQDGHYDVTYRDGHHADTFCSYSSGVRWFTPNGQLRQWM
jgi:hypothetical protein